MQSESEHNTHYVRYDDEQNFFRKNTYKIITKFFAKKKQNYKNDDFLSIYVARMAMNMQVIYQKT